MPQTLDPPWTSTSETWLRPVSAPCILMERSFKYRVFQTLKWVGFSVTAKKRFYKPPTLHTSGRCQQAFWGAFLDNRGSQTLFIYEIYTLWLILPSFDKSHSPVLKCLFYHLKQFSKIQSSDQLHQQIPAVHTFTKSEPTGLQGGNLKTLQEILTLTLRTTKLRARLLVCTASRYRG